MLLTEQAHKDLVGQIETKKARIEKIVAKGNDMTQEDLLEAQGLKTEIGTAREKIVAHNKVVELKGFATETDGFLSNPIRMVPLPDGGDPTRTPAGETIIERRDGRDEVFEFGNGLEVFGEAQWKAVNSKEYRKVYAKYLREGKSDLGLAERKLLEEGSDPQGGYLAPADMLNRLIQRQPTPTRVAGLVNNYMTSREFVEMLKVNYASDNVYTTGFRVTKTGEKPSSATVARVDDSNLFGTIKIPVHTFMITGALTNNQVEDSALNVLQWAVDKYRETIDILWDDKVLNGSGKGEAEGILFDPGGTDQPPIVVTGDANTFTADGLLNLNLDVPEQYDENGRYLLNKTGSWKVIRKLKDANNRYLIGAEDNDAGIGKAVNKTIDGYPVVFSGLMPNPAANAYPAIFGDFRGYQLVNRLGFSIQVLRELYAEINQVALVGRVRFGGQTVEPWRLRIQKCST